MSFIGAGVDCNTGLRAVPSGHPNRPFIWSVIATFFPWYYTPSLPTRFRDNLLGVCDSRLPVERLQDFFQMIYELDPQID